MLSLGANLNRFFKADGFYNLKDWESVGFFHASVKTTIPNRNGRRKDCKKNFVILQTKTVEN